MFIVVSFQFQRLNDSLCASITDPPSIENGELTRTFYRDNLIFLVCPIKWLENDSTMDWYCFCCSIAVITRRPTRQKSIILQVYTLYFMIVYLFYHPSICLHFSYRTIIYYCGGLEYVIIEEITSIMHGHLKWSDFFFLSLPDENNFISMFCFLSLQTNLQTTGHLH